MSSDVEKGGPGWTDWSGVRSVATFRVAILRDAIAFQFEDADGQRVAIGLHIKLAEALLDDLPDLIRRARGML